MMDPLLMIGAVTVAGVLIGGGVHFLPVGGVERHGSFELVVEHQVGCHFGHLWVSLVFSPSSSLFSPVMVTCLDAFGLFLLFNGINDRA